MNSLALPDGEREELARELEKVFKSGDVVYSGYVDDIRNTDNAWMETVSRSTYRYRYRYIYIYIYIIFSENPY